VKKTLEVGINHLALPLQRLDLPCELKPPLKPLIRREVLEVEEWVVAFRRKGVEQVIQHSPTICMEEPPLSLDVDLYGSDLSSNKQHFTHFSTSSATERAIHTLGSFC